MLQSAFIEANKADEALLCDWNAQSNKKEQSLIWL